jgi:aryl-alcohol dehydrogenase-like predicted oxidoreductase
MQFGWTADEGTSFVVLDRAFEAGINFIDTAYVYSRRVEGNPGGISETITWPCGVNLNRNWRLSV